MRRPLSCAAALVFVLLLGRESRSDETPVEIAADALDMGMPHLDEAESDLEHGSFHLGSAMELHSSRMPVLVDIFPTYTPGGASSAWGRGWNSASLRLTRGQPAGEPRFDDSDVIASPWGQLRRGDDGNWYPHGLRSRVRAELSGEGVRVLDDAGRTWLFAGAPFRTSLGISAWQLTTVFDQDGNSVGLAYTSQGNLSSAQWSIAGVPQHRVALTYQATQHGTVSFGAGIERTLRERVDKVEITSASRADGTWKLVASYEMHWEQRRPDLLLGITERRPRAAPRVTSYSYGVPWIHSDQPQQLFAAAAAASLPTYPNIRVPEHAIMAPAAKPLRLSLVDYDLDGITDLHGHANQWWIYDRAKDRYDVRGKVRPDESSPCANQGANAVAAHLRPGDTAPHLFDLKTVAQDRYLLSECRADGAFVFRTTLVAKRPTSPAACSVTTTAPAVGPRGLQPLFADINADGVPDLVMIERCTMLAWLGKANGNALLFGARDGDAFVPSALNLPELDPSRRNDFVDVNGDGLVDVLDQTPGEPLRVWYNRGISARSTPKHYTDLPAFENPRPLPMLSKGETNNLPCRRLLTHLDGDAFLDLVTTCGSTDQENDVFFHTGHADGFTLRRQLKNLPGMPLAATIWGDGMPGLAVVERLPQPRQRASDPCPNDRSSGGQGGRFWCSPLVQRLALQPADSDLLTRIDNHRGTIVEYRYRWEPLPAGFGRARSVLAEKATRITGRAPQTSRYGYGEPWLDPETRRFAGFRRVSATDRQTEPQGPTRTRRLRYDHQGTLSWLGELELEGHDFTRRRWTSAYEVTRYLGVALLRLTERRSALAVGADPRPILETRFAYSGDVPFDPSVEVTRNVAGPVAKMTRTVHYQRPSALRDRLVWLAASIDVAGVHTDKTLNFTETLLQRYDDQGRLLSRTRRSGALRVDELTRTYSASGQLETQRTAYAGLVRYQRVPVARNSKATSRLLATVQGNGGDKVELTYDDVSDAVSSVTQWRGTVRHTMRFTSDGYGRPVSETDEQFATAPISGVSYMDANGDLLGYRLTSTTLIPTISQRWRLDLFDGAGQQVGSALSVGKGPHGGTLWELGESTLRDELTGEWLRVRGGRFELQHPAQPTLRQILTATDNVILARGVMRPSSLSSEWSEYTGPTAWRRWSAQPSTDAEGNVTITATSYDRRIVSQTFNVRGHLVKSVSAGGRSVEIARDAVGRARRFRLPGGGTAAVDYDGLGRVSTVQRDGAVAAYTYKAGKDLLDCQTLTPSRAGAVLRDCYEWTAFGAVAQRESFVGDQLSNRVTWNYSADSPLPLAVVGKGFSKTFGYDDAGRLSSLETALYPDEAERPAVPTGQPRHKWRSVTIISEARADGAPHRQRIEVSADGAAAATVLSYREILDRHGWPAGVESPEQGFTLYSQRLADRTVYKMPDGRPITYGHRDALRRADWMSAGAGGPGDWSLDRTYDLGGATAALRYRHGATEEIGSYNYNVDGQLTTAVKIEPGFTTQGYTFGYDARGLLSQISVGATTHQVLRTPWQISVGAARWRLDEWGRISGVAGMNLQWGRLNEVDVATVGADRYRYVYDEMGQRLFRTRVDARGQRTTTAWVDGVRIADGETQAIPLRIGGKLLAFYESGGLRTADYDDRGNLRALAGKKQVLVHPYGERPVHTTREPELAGGYYDEVLGTIRFGLRDYVPELGQFSSPDPLFLQNPSLCAASPISCNLFTYARGNPVDLRDPTGMREGSGAECHISDISCYGGLDAHPSVQEQLDTRYYDNDYGGHGLDLETLAMCEDFFPDSCHEEDVIRVSPAGPGDFTPLPIPSEPPAATPGAAFTVGGHSRNRTSSGYWHIARYHQRHRATALLYVPYWTRHLLSLRRRAVLGRPGYYQQRSFGLHRGRRGSRRAKRRRFREQRRLSSWLWTRRTELRGGRSLGVLRQLHHERASNVASPSPVGRWILG